jgi:hypothetical protein
MELVKDQLLEFVGFVSLISNFPFLLAIPPHFIYVFIGTTLYNKENSSKLQLYQNNKV